MKPTLNKADIELLKGTFATKDDLVAMEKRQDQKFATKDDLGGMENRFDQKFATKDEINKRFDSLEKVLAETFQEEEERFRVIEAEIGITHHN